MPIVRGERERRNNKAVSELNLDAMDKEKNPE